MQIDLYKNTLLKKIIFLAILPLAYNGYAQTITTFAGNGTPGYNGDDAAAIATQLWSPAGLALMGNGTLLFADGQNNRVRKVNPSGTVTTIAGYDDPGNNGNGGPATNAELDDPEGVAVDGAGNIYISDRFNHSVRKITPKGIMTAFAGNGQQGFSGDDGPAVAAQLNNPGGITTDIAGNVFIADVDNNRIRKVTPDGIITTVAGTGKAGYRGDSSRAIAAQLNSPKSVAVDTAGNLYIADALNYRVRKVAPSGMITTIAGVGTSGFSGDGDTALVAELNMPTGVAVDKSGNVYIADQGNNCIRKITPDGIINTLAGRGADSTKQLNAPLCLVVDGNGILYVTEQQNHRIMKVIPAPPAPKIVKNKTKSTGTGAGKGYTPPPFASPAPLPTPDYRTSPYPVRTRSTLPPPSSPSPTHTYGRNGG